MDTQNVLKVNIPLSERPLYLSVEDTKLSLDSIFKDAVTSLANGGKNQESAQLKSLLKTHNYFVNGKDVSKGLTFKEMETSVREINNQNINFGEVTLLTSHTGGIF